MLENRNIATLMVAIVGAGKLILQAFGVDLITEQQIDALANGIAAVITIVGVVMTHVKRRAAPLPANHSI